MKAMYLLAVLILTWSCKQTANQEKETFPVQPGCYGYAEKGSKITFQITRVDPLVQGTLIYDWAEKDRNSGSFNGSFENGMILGTYTFISEGIESSREVAFKVRDSALIEGFGETQSAGKMTTFKNVDALNFNSGLELIKDHCLN